MRIPIIAATVVLSLGGCAYTADSAGQMSTEDLCITLNDRGSISGIPERNAAAELKRRGSPDCTKTMERYRAGVQAMREAIPDPKRPASPMICNSSMVGNQVYTTCQ